MPALPRPLHRIRPLLATFLPLVLLIVVVGHYLFAPAYGAKLGSRSLSLSDSYASANTLYALNFSLTGYSTIGSIKILFCSNNPLPDDPCVAPTGLDASKVALTDQGGLTGFSVAANAAPNEIVLTRAPAAATPGKASFSFSPITNPSTPGSYYARIQTYATTDASGPGNDFGGIAFAITSQLAISATVPPYLLFCTAITISGQNCANANGDYIDYGELSSTKTSSATSQMLVATNAALGYAVSIDGATLASGNNVIPALAAGDVSRPGTSQFGFNMRANSTPAGGNNPAGPGLGVPASGYNQPNFYRFAPGDTVVSTTVPDDVRVYTSNYIANVAAVQPAGIYVSTITYVCLANF